MITELTTRLQKFAAYTRLKRELRAMPLDVALDLGLFREDAKRTALTAIYG